MSLSGGEIRVIKQELSDMEKEPGHVEDVDEFEDETNPLEFIDSVDVVKVKTQCPECGKYLANLNEHMKLVHWKIKNHACSECIYRACFKNDLEKHMRSKHGKFMEVGEVINFAPQLLLQPFSEVGKVHSETKTTQCPHCDKFLANIKEHIKAVHMKEKNYFCNLCEYKTLFKSDLLKHVELVHRKLKKSCPECGKQVANLHEHIRIVHKKEKNFECNYCGYTCAKQSDMKKHTKNVHKVCI